MTANDPMTTVVVKGQTALEVAQELALCINHYRFALQKLIDYASDPAKQQHLARMLGTPSATPGILPECTPTDCSQVIGWLHQMQAFGEGDFFGHLSETD